MNVTADEKQVQVEVEVTNIGDKYPGKEVVQIYYSAPDGIMEKPTQELAGFAKTKLLAPGEKDVVTITFATTDMASFDAYDAAWVMEEGEYTIRVGNSSRNTEAVAVIDLDEQVTTLQLKRLMRDTIAVRELHHMIPIFDIEFDFGVPAIPFRIMLQAENFKKELVEYEVMRRTLMDKRKDEVLTLEDVKAGNATLGNNVTFSGNYASSDSYSISTSSGGAIYMQGVNSFLTIRNGAIFTNNYSSTYGGAIYLQGITTDNSSRFLAFTHDVLFSGNMTGGTFTQHNDGSFSVVNGVANAIHVDGTNHLQLAAAQEKEVRFNDPITSAAYFSSTENVTLSLNQYTDDDGISHATDGTVIFSGELYQGDNAHLVASRYSDFKGQTTLYGGSLILEHNVVFGNAGLRDDTSMTLEHGTLEITGGSVINAASFSITNGDAVLRPGTTAFINAKNVDLSRGFVFDMQKQAQETATQANPTGLSISASDSFTLGGSIGIMDTGISADYFYADNSWKQQRTFIVLTDSNQTHTDDFSGAHSLAAGSDRVDSPYAYMGSWSHQWVDADGDGFPEQLQLVWTPAEDSAIRDILPELAGTLAMNSMWSSAANALGMSRAALGNLDAQRFITGPENNYWVKGMGDFLNHASEGVRDGFDYHGGGYSVGADRRITSHAILGLGFGDLYGKMRGRSFAGDIDQQTRIGMLYGGWHKVLNRKNTLLVTGTAGYGWTDNKMNSFHTGGRSHGKWTNETLFGTFTGKWSRRVNETVAMEVMLGLEYTDVTQEAFTETGWDARRFEKGRLKNLSVPVGVGLTHRSELKDREWINSAMVSYVPDVYRRNPSAQAERLLNGYRWEAEGTSPDRNGVRVNVNSALQLNARWRMYAGYEFEGRSKATAHRFNAGVSYAY